MKKLSKIVALLLACTMAMLMFTACSGGPSNEDTEAEKKILSNYSTGNKTAKNNRALKAEAEKYLDEKISASGGLFGYNFVVDGVVKGKDQEYLTVIVAARYTYKDTLLNVVLNEISKKVSTDANVNINQNGSWTDIGVVVKTSNEKSYMAIAFKIKNPNYHK